MPELNWIDLIEEFSELSDNGYVNSDLKNTENNTNDKVSDIKRPKKDVDSRELPDFESDERNTVARENIKSLIKPPFKVLKNCLLVTILATLLETIRKGVHP